MKLFTAGLAVAFALLAGVAHAQQDREAVKKRILEAIEKKLRAEEDQLLSEIERLIYEELKSRGLKPTEPKPRPDQPKKARGRLGVEHEELTPAELKEYDIRSGVRIVSVLPGTAAEKAGLKAGDIVVRIDGEAATPESLPRLIRSKGPGGIVTLDVLRDGKMEEIKARLDRHPEDPPEPGEEDLRERIRKFLHRGGQKEPPRKVEPPKPEPGEGEGGLELDDFLMDRIRDLLEQFGVDVEEFLEQGDDGKWRLRGEYRDMFKGLKLGELLKRILPDEPKRPEAPAPKTEEPKPAGAPWLGVFPEELSAEQRAKLDIEEGVGLVVADTSAGSPAEQSLQKGDIILKIDDKPIAGEEGLKKFMAGAKVGQECQITIVREGKQQTVKVTLAERKE